MSSAARREEEEEAGLVRPAHRRPETWTTSRSTRATHTSRPIPEAPASTGRLTQVKQMRPFEQRLPLPLNLLSFSTFFFFVCFHWWGQIGVNDE